MEIKILSRAEALTLRFTHPEIIETINIISINDKSDKNAFSNAENILSLTFSDIEEDYFDFSEYNQNQLILFERKHTNKIIEFAEKMDKNKPLIVHCFAGISRSAAVALFIQAIYGTKEDFIQLFQTYDIDPNRFVFRRLCDNYFVDQNKKSEVIKMFDDIKSACCRNKKDTFIQTI